MILSGLHFKSRTNNIRSLFVGAIHLGTVEILVGNFIDESGLPPILSFIESLEGVSHNHLNNKEYFFLSIVVFDWEV